MNSLTNPAIELKNVTKTFGTTMAVDNLSLQIPEGSIYGLIGPNGSGKTTTMRMILNIFYPDNGSIKIFGKQSHDAVFDEIGYLPEERGLYKKMKVREMLQFYGKIKNGKNVDSEVEIWLKKLDLKDWAEKKVETLSKGMSQKVQFISTVVFEPKLLILDEPFTGLDPVNVDVIRSEILELRTKGVTVILSTHDMQIAENMCDFICMIFKGKKVLDGTLTSIQEKYGQDTIRIQTEDSMNLPENTNGIESIHDLGNILEIRFNKKSDPQMIIRSILAKTSVKKFEIVTPSLHDIFVRIVKQNDQGGKDA